MHFLNLIHDFPDSLMIGLNHLETTQLRLFMNRGKLTRLWAAGGEGTLHPLFLIPEGERYLTNFAWFDYIRPVSKHDCFVWRGKKEGTGLKESVRHEAPKQRLGQSTPPASGQPGKKGRMKSQD